MREKRKKIWIDSFQTYLSFRIAFYFVLYQAAVWALVVIQHGIYLTLADLLGPGMARYCFFFLASIVVVIGLLFIYDAVRLTHRLVGPLYRFRKVVQAIAAGEELERVALRKGDFLLEMKDDFNAMLEALEQRGAVTLKTRATDKGANRPVQV